MKDNPNDWLQQEMDYEGFVGRRGTFKVAHQKEENSTGWDAGAKRLAKMHSELEHHSGQTTIVHDNTLNREVFGIIRTIIVIFVISFIKTIFRSSTVLSYANPNYETYLVINGLFSVLLGAGIILLVIKIFRLIANRRN